jgi:DNA-binding LacI/PurR family transcriptional regulator
MLCFPEKSVIPTTYWISDTVSKVIHGKTEKISDKTVKRVQLELKRSGYIPNMAGILLARNNSRIIGEELFRILTAFLILG